MPPSPSSPVPPPDGLVEALGGIGLELTEAAHGRRWLAQAPDGRRSVVTVLAPPTPERAERMRARLLLVRRLAHPHLAAPTDVIELPGGAMAVLHAEVPGTDLRRLQGARGRWAAGEVVTVLVPLGRALAALHEAGLVHGDVSMANVVLDQHGRPVLIDVVSGADPEEQGTPGYAAPERERGATPAADVYALAMMGLRLLGPEDGEPAPPEETAVRQQLMGLLRTATATDPTERPTAAELADAVYAQTSAAPVTMPDAAVLAGLVLRQNAVPDPEEITRLRQPVARGRHRRPRTARTPALVAATTASLLLCAVLVGASAVRDAPAERTSEHTSAQHAETETAETQTAETQTEEQHRPVPVEVAAVELTFRRARALAVADASGLAGVSVVGSEAAVADKRVLHALRDAGHDLEARDLSVEVAQSTRLSRGSQLPWPTGERVLVRSRATTSGSTDAPAGAASSGGSAPRAVVLELRWTDGGWRVSSVEAPAR